MKIKILISDDHELFREGLRQSLVSLDRDVEIFEASNFLESFKIIQQNSDLALALIDLNMPDMDGFLAINKIMDESPTIPIAVLSASDDKVIMRKTIDIGVMGYIPKSESSSVIIGALQLILSGGVYVPPVLVNQATQLEVNNREQTELTPRQIEVLTLLSSGKSNKEIANDLDLSGSTIKAHISAIFKILRVRNRTQAVREADKRELLK